MVQVVLRVHAKISCVAAHLRVILRDVQRRGARGGAHVRRRGSFVLCDVMGMVGDGLAMSGSAREGMQRNGAVIG